MSRDAAPPLPPRPSVFLSYASEDRTAARALRDALAATGLEVWYDENELGGGDAWDQKIRRQIRDCDYFMPIISAATEARKEGYFRREWRLAAERTLDMADDVMFLLPVSIDSTSESGARVPDKFLTVQWLRLPGGRSTPSLESLCRRLLAGEHTATPRPPASSARPAAAPTAALPPLVPPSQSVTPADSPHDPHHPPPKPPFPHVPEQGGLLHTIKFLAEVVWWLVTAAWVLVKRAPKWIRILLSVWFVLFLFSRCSREPIEVNTDKKSSRSRAKEVGAAVKAAAEKAQADPNLTSAELAKLGSEFARNLAAGLTDKTSAAKSLAVVPFAQSLTDEAAAKFADTVFAAAFGRLTLARPGDIAQTPEPPAAVTDAALVALAQKCSAAHILAARRSDDGPPTLVVRLLRAADGTVVWSAAYPLDPATAPTVAEQISTAVLASLPAAK